MMMINQFFERMLTWFSPLLGSVTLVMAIIAVLCLLMGCYYMLKKEKFGKYLSLVGCLLLINPIIYVLTH